MEAYGICFSIPVAFVMSMIYCRFLPNVVRNLPLLRKSLYILSIALLAGFLGEVVLLATFGAVESRALVGPAFYVAHLVFFVLGTPALANVLVLHKRIPVLHRWYVAGVVCTVFAFVLVLLQYHVTESLYGVGELDGPYS